jgi:hypothetical protein
MRRFVRAARLSIAAGVLLISGAIGLLAFAGPTSAVVSSAVLTVTPNTGLSGGSVVSVSGTGFVHGSPGALLECNNDPNQPTIAALGNNLPVSCTNPISDLQTITAAGNLTATNFTVIEGKVGPPATGTDSASNSADADAMLYPCPPTAAQITAGDSCGFVMGDLGGDQAEAAISFAVTSTTTTPTTGVGTTTVPTTTPTTTTTTSPSTTVPTLSATAGGAVDASASGFNPGEAVNVTLESTPILLVQLFASSAGVVSSSIAIPAGTALGSHELIFTGVDSGHTVTFPLAVVAFPSGATAGGGTVPVAALTGATVTGAPSGTTRVVLANGTLAFTGAGPGVWFMAAGGLLLLNLGFLVMTMYYRPRELVAGAGRRVSRIFGGE